MTMEIDRTVELAVNGLTCGHCVQSVTEELSEVALDDDALREAVSEAGFELVSITRDF